MDISGWKLDGGASHRMRPGTVIPANGSLFLTPNIVAFRGRATAPKGGMGLFVQGNYNGHLNAWGETITLADAAGNLVASNSFAGLPSAAQRYLRITEIMYNPAPMTGNATDPQLFEYIELKNISTNVSLNLAGIRFTNGIYFNFTGRDKSLWRYKELLPIDGEPQVGLNSGFTPLIKADNLGKVLGIRELYIKDDTVAHPTLSFKDRVVAVAITNAKEFGFDTVACASTGEPRTSVSAHGAKAGFRRFVFIPATLEASKIVASLVYEPPSWRSTAIMMR